MPAEYTTKTPIPTYRAKTLGDVEDEYIKAVKAIKACNQDKLRIQEWSSNQ